MLSKQIPQFSSSKLTLLNRRKLSAIFSRSSCTLKQPFNMKKILSFAFLSLAIMAFTSGVDELEIGDAAPMTDLEMQDISGDSFSLNELKKDNGLLVIFSCNTCPFVIGWEDQYPLLADISERNNIGMVLVNSNEKKRKGADSLEEMKKHAEEQAYKSAYVVDENNVLADAFGARTTPHVYLFNKKMELIYRGSINDKYENKDEVATKFYLQEAIVNMMSNKNPDPAETRQMGCSIKRI